MSGRLEIQGVNNTWGTICDFSGDSDVHKKTARVACRQMKYDDGYMLNKR